MARWADYPKHEEEADLLSLLERLATLKPQGWSAVRGDREIVLRPAERRLGKFSITVSPSTPVATLSVHFHSRRLSIWVARHGFPLTAESAVDLLAWARVQAEDEAKAQIECDNAGRPGVEADAGEPARLDAHSLEGQTQMDAREGTVECEAHGQQPATFTCQHVVQSLRDRVPVGFFWANDPGNPRPDAWCAACEEAVQRTGGVWTDESEARAQVTLLCGRCYDRAKAMCRAAKGNT